MATTTNYGWTTPDDTALVKDGASAIRTLGSSVDTTTKNLNPETTLGDMSFRSSTSNVNTRIPIGSSGQHLTVVAGVPTWATASDQTPLTTKGDLFTFSTLDARLGVGANNTVLTADSAEATGLKWAAAAAGANWSLLNSGGTALTGAQTITVSGISGKDKIAIVVDAASSANVSSTISIRLNTDTGANYYTYGNRNTGSTSYLSDNIRGWAAGSDFNSIRLGVMSATSAATVYGFCLLTGCNASGLKMLQVTGGGLPDGSNGQQIYNIGGYYDSSSTISSISVFSASGNFDAGTVYVYTSA
jgi:hypothetical protein